MNFLDDEEKAVEEKVEAEKEQESCCEQKAELAEEKTEE